MFCPECGTENPEGKSYCRECGAQLNAETKPEAKPEPKLKSKPVNKRTIVAAVVLAAVVVCGAGAYLFFSGSLTGLFDASDTAEAPHASEIVLSEIENEKLRNYLSSKADENGDGTISVQEAEKVTKFGDVDGSSLVTDEGLSDLGIIDYGFLANFPNVEVIVCEKNQAASLDVSGLSKLKTLVCGDGGLIHLKASGCENLSTLDCSSSQLSTLDVSNDPALEYLDCSFNNIESLDIVGSDGLAYLECSDNRLVSLDVSGFCNLSYLDCSSNKLTSIKLSPSLESLISVGNRLTNLDFSGCSKLGAIRFDSGIEFGKATDVETIVRKNLSALALEYLFCLNEKSTIVDADRSVFLNCTNPEFALRLVHVALGPGLSGYGLGWYGADGQFAGELEGAGTALGTSGNSISDENLRKVLASFSGTSFADLASALGSFSSFTFDSSSSTWTWTPVTMSVSTNIYTNNFRVSGNLVRFDVGYQQQDNNYNDDVYGSYYTVVAIRDDSSIFGYHLVQIEDMTGDAASEFPALAAAQVASATPYDFTGTWAISDWGFTDLTVSNDGTCTMTFSSGVQAPMEGTWRRDKSDSESIVCDFEREDGRKCSIYLTGTLSEDVATASGSTFTYSGGHQDLGEIKVKRET